MHFYYLALDILAVVLLPVLVGYPVLWMLFGRDSQGVIRPPLAWHVLGILLTLVVAVLIRFVDVALNGRDALQYERTDYLSLFMAFGLPLLIALFIVRRIRKMALRRAVSRSHAPARAASFQHSPAPSHSPPPGKEKRPIAEPDGTGGTLDDVDESILLAIDEELESGNIDRATWIRAYAETDGEENRAKARYIRIRAARLKGTGQAGSVAQSGKNGGRREPNFGPK